MRTGYVVASIVAAISATAGVMSVAGPLDPPAGAVASSYKTLGEVEPRIPISATNTPGDADSLFRITLPGSYYLVGNIQGVSGKCGIEINTSNVVIDLGGYSMRGDPGTLDAIRANLTLYERLTVRNGTIDSWGASGVQLGGNPHTLVEDITASRCVTGIRAGLGSTVRRCRAVSNSFDGISVADLSTVAECQALSNSFAGIRGTLSVTVARSTVALNAFGLVVGGEAVVTETLARGNSDAGITLGDGGSAQGCTASSNGGGGFAASAQACFIGCTAQLNGTSALRSGFFAGERSSFTDCVSIQNGQHGFAATDSATVRGCTASDNGARGISVNNGAQVVGNLTRNNQQDGIYVNFSCEVRDNNCNGDGAAAGTHGGIRAVGQANRVDSNNVTFADRGVLIDQGGNIIVRNTCRGCTVNFSIAAGNADAQVLMSGAAFVATNPWANFSY
ncbi:MAG: hypothetical protein IT436_14155 [Phycisphaerales bacterium]|nr:hypothetical protein [Phycisphaerales bacterium]